VQAMSSDLQVALRTGGTVATAIEVLDLAGQRLAFLDALVTDGSVTAENALVRRHAELTLFDRDGTLTPKDAADLFMPYGNEIRPYRGMLVPDGTGGWTPELLAAGTLVITDAEVEYPTFQVSAYDRMTRFSENAWTSPFQVPKLMAYHEAIAMVAENRYPGVPMNFQTTGEVTPSIVFDENDPAQDLQSMATAIGMELYFSPLGVLMLAPMGDPSTDPAAWSYVEGKDSYLLSGMRRRFTREPTYNVVMAYGDSTDASVTSPYRALVQDNDPASPTYVGRFGRKSRKYASPLITSYAGAESAGRKILAQSKGLGDQAVFPGFVNPAHEVNDIVYVEREALGIGEKHNLDRFTIPMRAAGTMEAQTRATQTVVTS
jgi:hypothetical protein